MSAASSSIAAVREQFGPAAEAYAVSKVHVGGDDLDAMLAAHAFTGAERVLDLGTGAGHTAFAFARHAAEVVGIDVTPEMIAVAQGQAEKLGAKNVTFEDGDAARLPFAAASFDIVTSRHSAHHFPDPAGALFEARRVLRPGGRFLLVDAVSPENPALDTFLNTVEFLRDYSHVRDLRASEWLRAFDAAGFDAELVARTDIVLDGHDWVRRMRTPAAKVAMVRELLRDANPAQRAMFDIRDEPWGVTLAIGVFAATAR